MQRLLIVLLILALLPMAACTPATFHRQWAVADLRLLDPVDQDSSPSTDIIAVYTRRVGYDLEFRIDLLDLPVVPDYCLQITLDTLPGGNPRDLTITVPVKGRPGIIPSGSGIFPRVIRDPWNDTVTVRVNNRSIPRSFSFQVTAFPADCSTPADVTAVVRSDALPPSRRAPLALVFWNVFPAATPAQAMRRWEGAHTGPNGGRHGLKFILQESERYGIPVALLDLKMPASLAALDFLGLTRQVRSLSNRGLVILPDVAYGEPARVALSFSRLAAEGFGLPASQFSYSPFAELQSNYLVQFLPLSDSSHLARSGNTRLIPLPPAKAIQATENGPALDVRRALIAAALSDDRSRLVVLGGDLPRSTWGNENMAGLNFEWIAAHPWIQPLTAVDLISFPISLENIPLPSSPSTSTQLVSTLMAAGKIGLAVSAWQTYFTLSAPTEDEMLASLQAAYLGQVGEILSASRWADDPSALSTCDQDLDGDGIPECIISSQEFFAVLHPQGARLTNLFYRDAAGPHQIVGPSSQLTVGLSDRSEWNPGQGEAADPSVVPGAFSDETDPWLQYDPEISPRSITFTSEDGSRVKTFQLLPDGIQVSYQGSGSVRTRIPLVVDPQVFFFNPARFLSSASSGDYSWGLADGLKVEILSEANFSVYNFIDSIAFLSFPEDPDVTYPPGHYLPFPLSVVNIHGQGDFTVQIRVK
jgi:hypothetical protein